MQCFGKKCKLIYWQDDINLKGDNKKTSTFFRRILLSFYGCYNNDLHLILTTTKISIQNGINQPCRVNTFWSMDDYVSKLEKCCFIVLPLSDFLSKDSYALKMAD